jgi:hypothetical protein
VTALRKRLRRLGERRLSSLGFRASASECSSRSSGKGHGARSSQGCDRQLRGKGHGARSSQGCDRQLRVWRRSGPGCGGLGNDGARVLATSGSSGTSWRDGTPEMAAAWSDGARASGSAGSSLARQVRRWSDRPTSSRSTQLLPNETEPGKSSLSETSATKARFLPFVVSPDKLL